MRCNENPAATSNAVVNMKEKYIDRNYVVASKCSRNHFISEKYKTVKSFKLYLLQKSPSATIHFCQLLQRCWKHSRKPPCETFSALPSHS